MYKLEQSLTAVSLNASYRYPYLFQYPYYRNDISILGWCQPQQLDLKTKIFIYFLAF